MRCLSSTYLALTEWAEARRTDQESGNQGFDIGALTKSALLIGMLQYFHDDRRHHHLTSLDAREVLVTGSVTRAGGTARA